MDNLNLSDGQIDLLLIMAYSMASEQDPFEVEQEFRSKGLINEPSTIKEDRYGRLQEKI